MEKGTSTRRQRRLVERGAGRLAFITGQAHSLPSDPPPDSPLSTADAASTQLSEQQQIEGGVGGENFSNTAQLHNSGPSDVVPEFQRADTREEDKARTLGYEDELFRKFKTGSAAPEIQPLNETQPRREVEMRPMSAPLSQSNQADNAGWSVETLKEHLNFTPQEITNAISATESNRFLASVTIAFLVVLSNWGLDIGGTITRVLVGTRPLLFLIITNVTIVVTLLMEKNDPNARGRPVGGILGSVKSLGMLEIGLLLQKALGALLMDCSVCAVTMICFLGF